METRSWTLPQHINSSSKLHGVIMTPFSPWRVLSSSDTGRWGVHTPTNLSRLRGFPYKRGGSPRLSVWMTHIDAIVLLVRAQMCCFCHWMSSSTMDRSSTALQLAKCGSKSESCLLLFWEHLAWVEEERRMTVTPASYCKSDECIVMFWFNINEMHVAFSIRNTIQGSSAMI